MTTITTRTYNKALKFKIIPDLNQRTVLQKSFGCSRFIWNKMLAEVKLNYENNTKTIYWKMLVLDCQEQDLN